MGGEVIAPPGSGARSNGSGGLLIAPSGNVRKKGAEKACLTRHGRHVTLAMPDITTPAVAPAAEVAPAIAPNPDGATPPVAVVAAEAKTGKMTAKEALDGLNRLEFKKEPEWVLDEPERDILMEMEQSDDPLNGLYEDIQPPEGTADEQPAETAPVDPPAEAAPVDEQHAPELTDERVRTNINRKKSDGTFVHGERTRAALTLSHEQQIDYEEAYTRLFGDRQPATRENPAEAVPAKPEPTAAEIDAQLAGLKAKRKEARTAFNDEQAGDLTEQIEDLLTARQDALLRDVQRQQVQRETQSTVEQQVNASVGRAEGLYPDAAKPGTPLHGAIAAEVARLSKVPGAFADPEWPETVAVKIASRLGIAARLPAPTAKPVAPAAKLTAPAARKPATSVPNPSPGSVTSPPAPVSKHAELRQRMQAAKASGNLVALQRLGDEIMALSRAA